MALAINGQTQYNDGDARGPVKGNLILGDDGVNIQSVAVDATGHLQVDVLSGGTTGTQYADGAPRGTATGTLSMGDDGVNIQSVAVDSSGHLQVDVLSGTNIDVDVVSGGGGTQYADGAVRGTATGTLMMVDDGVNIQSAAGTAAGLLKVDLSESGGNPIDINVNTTGNVAINDGANDTIKATVLDYVNSNPLAVRMTDTNGDYVAAGAGTQYADGAARGTATGTLSMGDDGVNIQSVAVDSSGHLQVDVLSGTNIDVDVVSGGGGTQYADGAVRGTATGTLMMVDDGVNIQSAAGTTAGLLKVEATAGTNLNTSLLALEAGGNLATIAGDTTSIDGKITTCNTGAIAGSVTANQSTASNLKNEPAGNVAHDAIDSGNPIKIGGRAETTFQAAVSDGDRVDALFDVYGQLRTRPDNVNSWSYHENSSNALTDAVVQAAPGAGLSVYITDIVFSTGAATACNVFLEEGASTILGPYYLEAINGRGCAIHLMTPKKCTANTAITVTTSAAIAHSVDITGFIAP